MNEKVESFEERLKYAMSIRGKTQSDIAKNFNWSRSTVSQYCNPHITYKPKADRMYQIAEYLNVNPTWLMGYDVPMVGLSNKEKLMVEINEMDNSSLERFMAYIEAFKSVEDKLKDK